MRARKKTRFLHQECSHWNVYLSVNWVIKYWQYCYRHPNWLNGSGWSGHAMNGCVLFACDRSRIDMPKTSPWSKLRRIFLVWYFSDFVCSEIYIYILQIHQFLRVCFISPCVMFFALPPQKNTWHTVWLTVVVISHFMGNRRLVLSPISFNHIWEDDPNDKQCFSGVA